MCRKETGKISERRGRAECPPFFLLSLAEWVKWGLKKAVQCLEANGYWAQLHNYYKGHFHSLIPSNHYVGKSELYKGTHEFS
jgi:hypothetical protein